MKKESFKKFLGRINREEFIEYYRIHNIHDTAVYFDTNVDKIAKLSEYYEFKKSPEEIKNTSKCTFMDKYGVDNPSKNKEILDKIKNKRNTDKVSRTLKETHEKKFQELLGTLPSKEELYQEYIVNDCNHSYLMSKYNLTDWTLNKIINYYDLHKSKKQSCIKGLKTKYEIYGPDNFNNWKKGHETRILNSGSLEESYRKGIIKSQETCLHRYGVKCIYQLDNINYHKKNTGPNLKFKRLLEYNDIEFSQEFPLDTKSYDFRVYNNLIEINPSVTHNSTYSIYKNGIPTDKNYHFNKSKLARDNGYKCIHVWDWDDKDKIIQLLLPREVIYARNCDIQEVDLNIAREYLNKNHLQGYAKDNIRIGLFYNSVLVSIMTFGKPRYNKNYEYELIRYCSIYNITGGAERLFKYFIKKYNPNSIISYCDWSKFNGDVYTKLGFQFKNYSIGKHWYNIIDNIHITDNLLRQRGFDQLFGTNYGKGTSNEELMLGHGFVEIYDSGQAVYEWKIF